MPAKWWEVCDNTERKVFIGSNGKGGLTRNPNYNWRSLDKLVKDSGLSAKEVERIVQKYEKTGVIIKKPESADLYGYWEIVSPDLKNETGSQKSLSEIDKNDRIKRQGAANRGMTTNSKP